MVPKLLMTPVVAKLGENCEGVMQGEFTPLVQLVGI
jgi:hypothetical protein